MKTKSPRYLFSMFSTEYSFNTRQANSGQLKPTRRSNLDISLESFRWRAAKSFNNLPINIRQAESVKVFKTGLLEGGYETMTQSDMGVCAGGCPIPTFTNFNLRDFFSSRIPVSILLLDLKLFDVLTQAKMT